MRLNEIKDRPGATHAKKRVGRGPGSGLAKTSGHGIKGQKARSGVAIKGFEGGQMPLDRRLPKRGFTNIFRTEYQVVNLADLAALGVAEVTLEVLKKARLVKGRDALIKVLGDGELKSAITVHAHKFSKSAQEKIAKAGGKAEILQ